MDNNHVFTLNIDELRALIEEGVTNALSKVPTGKENIVYLKRKDVAKMFGISVVTLRQWTKEGLIKDCKIKSRVFYKQEEVMEALGSVKKYDRK